MMKLSRRKFVYLGVSSLSLGLISVSGLYLWNNYKFKNNAIEIFLSSYENILPFDTELSINYKISQFENKIISLLQKNGIEEAIQIINKNIKNEYQLGKLKLINGWIISETELKILLLKKKYV